MKNDRHRSVGTSYAGNCTVWITDLISPCEQGIQFDDLDQKCSSPTLTNASLITEREVSVLSHSVESKSSHHGGLRGTDFARSRLQDSPRAGSTDQKTVGCSPVSSFRDLSQRMRPTTAGSKECRSPLSERASFSSPGHRIEATMTTVEETNENSGDENLSDYVMMVCCFHARSLSPLSTP